MQFKFDCKTYLVNSSTKPTRDQLESTSDKRQLPMEGMVFADAEASNWRPDQKESITVSPIASNSGREISYPIAADRSDQRLCHELLGRPHQHVNLCRGPSGSQAAPGRT